MSTGLRRFFGFLFTGALAAGGAIISQLMLEQEAKKQISQALDDLEDDAEDDD